MPFSDQFPDAKALAPIQPSLTVLHPEFLGRESDNGAGSLSARRTAIAECGEMCRRVACDAPSDSRFQLTVKDSAAS